MRSTARSAGLLALILMAAVAIEPSAAQASDDYAAQVLAGISNQGRTQRQPYVTAGDRTYLIGTQDGNFPPMGHHVPGEMGGLWLPPIKLIDGFQARIAELGTNKEILLAESTEMITYPYGNRFRYGRVLDDLEVDRFQFSPDQRPGWYADHLGIRDAQDLVDWRENDGVFIARDADNPWFCVWGAVPPANAQRIEHSDPIATGGYGVTAAAIYTVTVGPHSSSTLSFVVSGSTTGQSDALAAYDYLAQHHVALLAQKVAHFAALRCAAAPPPQRLGGHQYQ